MLRILVLLMAVTTAPSDDAARLKAALDEIRELRIEVTLLRQENARLRKALTDAALDKLPQDAKIAQAIKENRPAIGMSEAQLLALKGFKEVEKETESAKRYRCVVGPQCLHRYRVTISGGKVTAISDEGSM